MRRSTFPNLVLAGLMGLMSSLQATPAQAVDVSDEAGFFSQQALDKANTGIADLRRKHGKELRVETFKNVPADKRDEVSKMDKSERDRFFEKWARDRAMGEHAKGIFILICREPGHVQIEVDRQTREQAFGSVERKELRDKLLAGFQHKDYDKALLDAVGYVSQIAQEKLGARAEAPLPAAHPHPSQPSGGLPYADNHSVPPRHVPARPVQEPARMGLLGWAIVAVVAFFGFRLLATLFRSITGGGQSAGGYPSPNGPGYPQPGYGGGMGGGGMAGGLMTGLFGALAGNWIYNSFFGNSAHAGQQTGFGGENDRGRNVDDGAGQDFQGTGGDVDDRDSGSGGGDFGDSGGGAGDFSGDSGGGGDFGGGGDDGGGGDF